MSRYRVLKDIDRNTKYFQLMASFRQRRKLMVEIKKGQKNITMTQGVLNVKLEGILKHYILKKRPHSLNLKMGL